ncbi:MAG: 5-formyltetrahydrofolate cyclo-ligase [Actinomycetota bacterium]|jgi:5-formyltetrahydrofolate cyclo-ligase
MRNRFRAEREFHHEAIDWNIYRWEHLIESSEFTTAKVIASYISYGTEPDTHHINCEILAAQKTLLLPRMMPDKNLEWVQWDGNQELLTSNGRIHEPLGEAFKSEADLILVPALHVDRQGNRLGQGGGSYDRALSSTHAYTIALVYAGELTSEEIPVEPHDVKMKAVATPELLVRFTARN